MTPVSAQNADPPTIRLVYVSNLNLVNKISYKKREKEKERRTFKWAKEIAEKCAF